MLGREVCSARPRTPIPHAAPPGRASGFLRPPSPRAPSFPPSPPPPASARRHRPLSPPISPAARSSAPASSAVSATSCRRCCGSARLVAAARPPRPRRHRLGGLGSRLGSARAPNRLRRTKEKKENKMENMLFCWMFFTLGWTLIDGSEMEQDFMWHLRKIPRVVSDRTFHLTSTTFEADAKMVLNRVCGIECQKELPAPSLSDLEDSLSYETVFENGTRTLTRVKIQDVVLEPTQNISMKGVSVRRKRQVYGTDSRFSILDKKFLTNFPFNTAVKLSTGCSGILISPSHVLTAAHCVHDGKDYIKGSKKLRVGLLKMRNKGGGKKRRGSKRSRREVNGGDQREGAKDNLERAKGGRRRKESGRGQRVAEGRPSFQWTRVKNTHIPKGWARGGKGDAALDYDYALLELKRAHKKKYMELGISPTIKKLPGGMIHFSGFDHDRADQLVYRFCSVSDESSDLLYQYCDAESGSTGSGVYLRLKEPDKKNWKRKIIAVYSGHQWVDVHGVQKDYNVAVRITPLKYAQICLWIHGDNANCTYG